MAIKVTPEDRLFSLCVRGMADGCEYCGKKGRLETSHFHGRRKRSVRWDFDNAAALCNGCHRMFHENPYKHTEFFRQRLGAKRFEQLNIRAETIRKWRPDELADLRADLKERVRVLES